VPKTVGLGCGVVLGWWDIVVLRGGEGVGDVGVQCSELGEGS
jgi:hypothetical protein